MGVKLLKKLAFQHRLIPVSMKKHAANNITILVAIINTIGGKS